MTFIYNSTFITIGEIMDEKKVTKKYNNIRIPNSTYESLIDLKTLLRKKGLDQLPKDLIKFEPRKCPQCNYSMNEIQFKGSISHCPNCGFTQPVLKLEVGGALALGALIGLGIAGLIYLLTKDE